MHAQYRFRSRLEAIGTSVEQQGETQGTTDEKPNKETAKRDCTEIQVITTKCQGSLIVQQFTVFLKYTAMSKKNLHQDF